MSEQMATVLAYLLFCRLEWLRWLRDDRRVLRRELAHHAHARGGRLAGGGRRSGREMQIWRIPRCQESPVKTGDNLAYGQPRSGLMSPTFSNASQNVRSHASVTASHRMCLLREHRPRKCRV